MGSAAEDIPQIFGIDLGTTYSCIAYVDEGGRPVVVPNAEGELTTPSVVYFESPSNRVVGKEAKNTAVASPDLVVELVKREMGNSAWRFTYSGGEFTPEEISSYILRKVVGDAETQVGHNITNVVITCPAYFDAAQRASTKNAGEIARMNVRAVIEEPVAAAIAYGFQEERDQTVLVYDLGGGTFDITMIEIKEGALNMIALGGDSRLGGRDWDERVVAYVANEWMRETGITDDPRESLEALQDLWTRVEIAKKSLTSVTSTKINLAHAGRSHSITLTREKFDELTGGLLERTIQLTNEMLAIAAQKGHAQFDHILLVGGSTSMPQVSGRLEREYPGIPIKVFDPNQAVAKGAAIFGLKLAIDQQISITMTETHVSPQQAQVEVARKSGLTLKAVQKLGDTTITVISGHSYGIIAIDGATDAEIIANLIQAQTSLPISTTQQFGTHRANQRSVEIPIVQNEVMRSTIDEISKGRPLETATIDELPSGLPSQSPIDVTFEMDTQGMLNITAVELTSGKRVQARLQTEEGATVEEIDEAKERAPLLTING